MATNPVAPYLDDDGNEVKASPDVKLPSGYQLLSSKKKSDTTVKPVKELKAIAATKKPASPPKGYILEKFLKPMDTPVAYNAFTENPKNEGLYEMYGKTGQGEELGSFKVPYSKVRDSLLHGNTFYNGSQDIYEKDKEAEGKPASWFQKIVQSPALAPVPHEAKGGTVTNVDRAAARMVLGTPEYVKSLVEAAKSMHEGSVAGGDEFAKLINPYELPKQMYAQYQQDRKTYPDDPKLALDNLVGSLLGLGVVGEVTHRVGEKAKGALSSHPFTPINETPVRERTNVVHRNNAGEVRQAKGQAPAVWLSPDAWKSLMNSMYPAEDHTSTNGMNLPFNKLHEFSSDPRLASNPEVQELLTKAHENAGDSGASVVSKTGKGVQHAIKVVREELNHSWQRGLANGNVNEHLDPQSFTNLYHAIPSGMYDHLIENGYSGHNSPEMVTEAAAKLMDGRPERFGVTEDDAVSFLDKYFKEVTDKHGAKALEELQHVRGIAADAKARAIEEHTRSSGGGSSEQPVSSVAEGRSGGAAEGVPVQGEVNATADPLFNREKAKPTWYLKSERMIADKMRGPMPAGDVQKMLVAGGIKPEEMLWTGLQEFLDSKGGNKVTPEEVRQHLADNNIQIKEVMKPSPNPVKWNSYGTHQGAVMHTPDGYTIEPMRNGMFRVDTPAGMASSYHTIEEAKAHVDQMRTRSGANIEGTKFSQYQLEGGENYKEMLLTLPRPEFDPSKVEIKRNQNGVNKPEWETADLYYNGKLMRSDVDDYDALDPQSEAHLKDIAKNIYEQGRGDNSIAFTAGHWDEPNVLAHVRFNDRKGPNGEKLLHVEEVQSDMMQSMRKQREAIAQHLSGEGFYDIIKKMQDDGTIEVEC